MRARALPWLPPLVYLGLAVYLALPMLRPGDVLLLDHAVPMAGNEHVDLWRRSGSVGSDLPLNLVLFAGGRLLGSQVLDRAWFVAMLTLAGWGGFTLAEGVRLRYRYVAGLLVVVNPWTWERVLSGQWTVLLAFACLPWLLRAWLGWSEAFRWRRVPLAVLLAATAVAMSLPMGLLAVIGAGVATLPSAVAEARRRPGRVSAQYGALGAGLLLTQLHWLGALYSTSRITAITGEHLDAFQTLADSRFGLAFNVLALYGFWRVPEGVGGAVLTKWFVPIWPLLALALMAAATAGAAVLWRGRGAARRRGAGVALMALFAFGFAMGGQGATGPLFRWAFEHVPWFEGFREPQKASGLLVVAYSYLGVHGLAALHRWFERGAGVWATRGLVAVAAGTVLLASAAQVMPGSPALRPLSIPAAWHEARDYIAEAGLDGRTLVLPWHQYYAPSFGDRRAVADPAAVFFRAPLTTGDNLEVAALYSESTDPTSGLIEAMLGELRAGRPVDVAGIASVLGVRYILLLHETDHEQYSAVSVADGIERLREWPGVTLYRNNLYLGRLFAPPLVTPARALPALVGTPRGPTDLLRAAPVAGVAATEESAGRLEEAEVTPTGARGRISAPGWVVFTDPFDERLALGGQRSSPAYGAVNAFFVPAAGEFEITMRGLTRLWASRAVSAAAWAAAALLALGMGASATSGARSARSARR